MTTIKLTEEFVNRYGNKIHGSNMSKSLQLPLTEEFVNRYGNKIHCKKLF